MKRDNSRNESGAGDPDQLTQLNTRVSWRWKRTFRDCRDLAKIKGEQIAEDALRFYFGDTDEMLLERREYLLGVFRKLRKAG